MRIPSGITYKHAEVERAAATKDVARPALMDAYLDTGVARLVATDSYVLVSLPVELDDGDVSGWVPTEALKAARKARIESDRRIALDNGAATVKTPDGTSTFDRRNDRGEFVNWQQLIPEGERDDEVSVSLNAEKLLQAAKALGSDIITLRVLPGSTKPVIVHPIKSADDRVALVMPVRGPAS